MCLVYILMHRALSIPEVLQLVLSSDISQETIRNAALTCSLWKDPALDRLWKELDSVFPLVWVLIPLELEATTKAPFPHPGALKRFEAYGRRIRKLVFDISPDTGDTVGLKAFQTIAQVRRPDKDLLPNLRKFTYNARRLPSADALSPFLIFLGNSIVELELLEIISMAVPDFLEHLAQGLPQVQWVRIEGTSRSYASSSTLASSLIQLGKLRHLEVLPIPLTPAVWNEMAQHPSLISAELTLSGNSPDAIGFQPRTFAQLEYLAIQANFDLICGLFQSQNDLPTLTRINLRGHIIEHERSDFYRLCNLLPRKLPHLASVVLRCRTMTLSENEPLKLEDFRPLLQCGKLQKFLLEHPCGVSVTSGEVGELLDAWPRIETLGLQYAKFGRLTSGVIYSLKWSPPTLPLDILNTVAEKAPKIKGLSLVLDATTPIDTTPSTHQQQFACLQELEVTLSTVGQPKNVASYLAQCSKKRFSLKYLHPQKVQEGVMQIVKGEKKKWDKVMDYLGLLFDQKEILEQEFKLRMIEERAKIIQELSRVAAPISSMS
ncbi:hypothetical protein FRC00_006187 [Tulasnella sp. 408]|nr:hypothetical protein FRC00_006187 [Tulasnella sp. 408]